MLAKEYASLIHTLHARKTRGDSHPPTALKQVLGTLNKRFAGWVALEIIRNEFISSAIN